MKLKKIIYVGLILFVLMGSKVSMAQDTTIYVTDAILANSSGSLDSVLLKAIPRANAGRNVTVLFSAPGLCQIDEVLPVINISSGSLTLKKDPASNIEQGIQYASDIDNSGILSGFYIDNGIGTSITFDSLYMKDFISNANQSIQRSAIHAFSVPNLLIENCSFSSNFYSINCSFLLSNLIIQNNIFYNDTYSIYCTHGSLDEINVLQNIEVKHNYFTKEMSNQYSFAVSVNYVKTVDLNDFELNINDNFIKNYTDGIDLWLSMVNVYTDDLPFNVFIKENKIINCYNGLVFTNPYNKFIVDHNILDSNNIHILIQQINWITFNLFGLDFIGQNSAQIPVKNSNNIFKNCRLYSIAIINMFNKGNNIIGQNLDGQVSIIGGKHTNIRETVIPSSLPIKLWAPTGICGNYNISSPTLDTVTKSGSSLIVKYRLNGIHQHVQANSSFVTEFFKSNKYGHLLEFLGNHTVNTLTGNEYTAVLNFPSGVVPDTIVATVTSLGNQPTSTDTIGTSPASPYKNAMPSPCYDGELSFCFPEQICSGDTVFVTNNSTNRPLGSNVFMWNYGDGSQPSYDTTHVYASAGNYTVTLIIPAVGSCPRDTVSKVIAVDACSHECKDCIASFTPEPGKKYVLGAWVKEDGAGPSKTAYTYATIQISFAGNSQVFTFEPKGSIIDGWQRIEEEFTIPQEATDIKLKLISSQGNCFFDDIRVFPFDGTMKSYVYDPISLRLVSELDEHNYATFYEYDEEGKLIRVKKETERGIMTIKENKNSSVKN